MQLNPSLLNTQDLSGPVPLMPSAPLAVLNHATLSLLPVLCTVLTAVL